MSCGLPDRRTGFKLRNISILVPRLHNIGVGLDPGDDGRAGWQAGFGRICVSSGRGRSDNSAKTQTSCEVAGVGG